MLLFQAETNILPVAPARPVFCISIWMIASISYGAVKTRGFQSGLVNIDVPREEA